MIRTLAIVLATAVAPIASVVSATTDVSTGAAPEGVADPRIRINEAQIEARWEDALSTTEAALRQQPEFARSVGLDYLRGHLLRQLGRLGSAHEAFAAALDNPRVSQYSRYWLARHQADDGHPEVASGLLATLLASGPPSSLVGAATKLLSESIRSGGDCRLLTERRSWGLPKADRRRLDVVHSECELRRGRADEAAEVLISLIREERRDDSARRAAILLIDHVPERAQPPEIARLVGMTLSQHREFDLAEVYLGLYLAEGAALPSRSAERYEAGYALARSHFWREQYVEAAAAFGDLLDGTRDPETNAKVLYQQGRSHELAGEWERALTSFSRAETADPSGSWASAAILSALRIHWRSGNEEAGLEAYAKLTSKSSRRKLMGRAALFLAASDLVRSRTDRAGQWLEAARRSGAAEPEELSYWFGRFHEESESPSNAVAAYLSALREDAYGPFGQSARARLAGDALTAQRRSDGLAASRSTSPARIHDGWLLLRDDLEAPQVAERLRSSLRSSTRARSVLDLRPVPVGEWPLWKQPIDQTDEILVAIGGWGPVVDGFKRHFPFADTNLALTGGQVMMQRGAVRRGVYVAEVIQRSVPSEIPPSLLPVSYRRLLYPNPYDELISRETAPRNVPPSLVASIIREESRFDPDALSAASARGLTQFILPTARRLAPKIGKQTIDASELHMPEISIALGAAYLEELLDLFRGHLPSAVASYNAGERQALLWQSYCFSKEPAEYVTKIGFPETRNYVRKVLAGKAHYEELYSVLDPSVEITTGGSSLASTSQ